MLRKSSTSLKQRVLSAVMGSIMLFTSVTPALASTASVAPTANGEAISSTESPITYTGKDFNILVKDYVAGTDNATTETLDDNIQKIVWSTERPAESTEAIKISETGDIFAWYRTADELKAEAEGQKGTESSEEEQESSILATPEVEESSQTSSEESKQDESSNAASNESSAAPIVEESSTSSNSENTEPVEESSSTNGNNDDSKPIEVPKTEESEKTDSSLVQEESSQPQKEPGNKEEISTPSELLDESSPSVVDLDDITETQENETSEENTEESSDVTAPITGSQDEYKNTLFIYSFSFENDLPILLNKDLSYMFAGMTALEDISFLYYMDASQVESMDFMFAGNTSLKDVSPLKSFNVASLKSAKGMFLGADKLESVSMAPGEYQNTYTKKTYNAWTPSNIINGKDAFEGTKVSAHPVWYSDYLIALEDGTFTDPDEGDIKETEGEVNIEDIEKFNAARTNENYILEKANASYVNATKAEIVNVLKIKQTLFDGTVTGSNETIDSIMQTESAAEKLITMLVGAVPVYNVDDESDYYVAFADTMLHDSTTHVQDYITAEDNTDGVVIDGTIYDAATGLLYIPKSVYVDDAGTYIIGRIQIQLMQIVDNFNDTDTLIPVTIYRDDKEEPAAISKDLLDLTTKISVVPAEEAASYDKSNLLIVMNGLPLKDTEYTYNGDGTISINYSPSTITNVSITVDEPSVIEELLKALSSPARADYSDDSMGYVKQSAVLILPKEVKEGDVFTGMLHYKYQQGGDYGNAYTFEKGNLINSAQNEVVDLIDNGGILADDQIFALQDTGLNFEADLPASSFSNGNIKLDFSGVSENVTLQCAHTSVAAELEGESAADDYWMTRTGKIRILRIDEDDGYLLMGVLTMRTNSQNGYGIIKLRYVTPIEDGTVTVQKKSANSSLTAGDSHYSLAGATFKIYSNSSCTKELATITTGSDGKTPKVTLKEGTYYLREESAPAGFLRDTTVYKIELKAGDAKVIEVKNTPYNKGSVKLYKYDDVFNEPISEADFTLYKWSKASSKWVSMGLLYNMNTGYYTSGSLYADPDNPNGEFRVVETTVPEGYTGAFDKTFKLDSKGTEFSFTAANTPVTYKIILNKFDTGIPTDKLAGAEFKIVEFNPSSGDYNDPATTGITMTWDATNEYYWAEVRPTNINHGFFKVYETKAPAGYAGGFTRTFDISNGAVEDPTGRFGGILTIDAGNTPLVEQGKVQVKKSDSKNSQALEGAVFEVYEYDSKAGAYKSQPFTILVYNSSTKMYESAVPLYRYDRAADVNQNDGKYKVVEKTSPAGYINEGWSKEFTVAGNNDFNTVQTFSYDVPNTSNEFVIHKVSGQTTTGIPGVVFRVTNTSTGIKNSYTTDANGKITLSCIAPGMYEFVEISAPDGYEMDTTVYHFFVADDGKIDGKTSVTHVVRNYPYTVLSIVKTDAQASKYPDANSEFPNGIEFTIYEYSKAAGNKYKTEVFCKAIYRNGIFVNPDTNAEPKLMVTDDNAGKFKVVETATTPGYALDTANPPSKEITISAVASTEPVKVSFENTPNVIDGLKLTKEGTPLANVIFEIWKDGDTSTLKYATTDANGKFYFARLEEGHWYLRESKVPYGYAIEPTIYEFTVDENGLINGKSTITQTFENAKKYWLSINKTDSETGVVLDAGTEFDLYEWSEDLGAYKKNPSMHIIHKDQYQVTAPTTGRNEEPLIAVIDTGFNADEFEIDGIYSVVEDDGSDKAGHGTSIISTILAENPDANIISIKAMNSESNGSATDIVEAIDLAVEKGASIINLSAIGKATKQNIIINDAIKRASDKGITVVVAAGNQNDDVANYVGANLDEALVVAATDGEGLMLCESNYGETVDLAVFAPTSSYATAVVTAWISVNGTDNLDQFGYDLSKFEACDHVETVDIGDDIYIQGTYIHYSQYPSGAVSTGGVADYSSSAVSHYYVFQYPGGQSTCSGTSTSTITTTYNANGGSCSTASKNSTVTTTKTWTFSHWYCEWQVNSSYLTQQSGNKWVGEGISFTPDGWLYAYGQWSGPSSSKSGAAITLPSASKTGHQFAGWYTAASGGTRVGGSGSSYSPTSSGTLYAHWTANTYTIAYNANGGSGTMTSHTGTYGVDDKLKANTFTRTGYTFAGWYCYRKSDGLWYCRNASDARAWYKDGAIASGYYKLLWSNQSSSGKTTPVNGDTITFYAQWTPKTYTVTYNANGGSGSMSSSTATYNSGFRTRQNAFTRSGYTFNGWNEKADGTGTAWTLSSNGVYEAGKDWTWTYDKNITLYAQWKASSVTNTIAHWRWVGSGGNNSAGTQYNDGNNTTFTGNVGTAVTIPSSHVKSFTGYHNTGVAGGTWGGSTWTSKNIGSTFTQPSSGVYIEYYYEPNTYTITYAGNGNTGGSTANTSATYDQNVTLATNGFTKTGYTFNGWKHSNGTVYSSGQTLTKPNFTSTNGGSITLTAQWSANTYTIAYNANGGSGTMANTAATYDQNVTLRTNAFTRDGYTFQGWNTAANGSGTSYSNGASVKNLTSTNGGTANLYAQWKINTYVQKVYVRYEMADTYDTYFTDYELKYNQSHDWGSTFNYSIAATDTHEGVSTSYTVKQANEVYLTVLLKNPGRDLTYVDDKTGLSPVLYETEDNKGKYMLIETKAKDGYILDSTPIYFTMSDANSDNVVTLDIDNTPNHYYIKKVDKNNQPLAGATFQVWKEGGSKTSYTTGADGTIALSKLAPGTWYFQETAAPSGYSAFADIHRFMVDEDGNIVGSNTFVMTNARNDDPSFQIYKLDSNGSGVPGVEFTLTSPSGSTSTVTTNSFGYVVISDLTNGTYYYQEKSAQTTLTNQGLIVDTTKYSFTVSGTTITRGDGTVSKYAIVTNNLNSFTITKQSSGGALLDGAVFNVWHSGSTTDKTSYTTVDGKITLTGLKPGTWYYQEITAPEGYILDSTVRSFTVAADATINGSASGSTTVTNNNIVLTINKVNGNTNAAISGVKFQVWNSGDPSHNGTYTTNASGKITLSGLVPGTYYYKEVSAPAGYAFDSTTKSFTVGVDGKITGDGITNQVNPSITVKNYPTELVINKTDANGNPLSGVKFIINGTTYTTDANGKISVTGLAPGSYEIKERSTLTGYIPIESSIDFEITSNGEIKSSYSGFSFTNGVGSFAIKNDRYVVGKVTIKKYDSTTGQIIPTRDAVFRLYEWNGSAYYQTSKKSTATADGTYVISDIYMSAANMGKFKIVEESAPDGYLSSYESEFTLSGTNRTQEITLNAGNEPNSYVIQKQNESGQVLKGVIFKVWKTGAENAAKTYTTDSNGQIKLTALTTGEWNYQEIATLDGYMLDMTIHKFTVDSNHKISNQKDFVGAPVINYEYKPYFGSVELKKVDEAGVIIDIAEFDVYAFDVATGDYKDTPYTTLQYDSTSKTYKNVADLRRTDANQGRFLIKETKSLEGYASSYSKEIQIVIGGDLHQTFSLEAVNKPNKVFIKKTNESGVPLAGATFRIQTVLDDSKLTADEMLELFWSSNVETDANGVVTFSKLKPGDYKVFELHSPSGYTLDSTEYEFTVKEDGMIYPKNTAVGLDVYEITAVNKQNEVTIHKVNSDGMNLSGATFYIYSDDVSNTYTLTTDNTGKITLKGLPDGKWYFKETQAPSGYQLNTSVYTFTIFEGGIIELDVALPFQQKTFQVMNLRVNEDIRGEVFIQKLSAVDDKPLTGVGFSVFEFDGTTQQYKQIATNSLTYDASLKMYKITGLKVTPANEGKYLIAETTTPDGYAGTWKTEIDLTKKRQWQFSGTTAVYNDLNQLTIEKLDEATKEALPGVQFEVYVEGLDAGTPIAQDANGNTITNHQILTTDANGHIILRGLKNDTTYYYKETKTIKGYLLDHTVHSVIVQDNGTLYGRAKHTVQVYNTSVMITPSLHTGGPGRYAIYFTGCTLLTYSIIGTVYTERKKRRSRVK